MKKNLFVVLIAAILATGAFAQNAVKDALDQADAQINEAAEQFPKGTWIDSNWDAAWEFGINNTIILKDSKTGEVIYNFAKDKRSNYKINVTDAGLVISFRCNETQRNYKFTKPVNLSTDIILEIDADFLNEHYKVNMKFKK